MKKRFPLLTFIIVALGTFIYSLGSAPQALAVIDLMNGDLRLDGFVKEYIWIRDDIPRAEQRFHHTNADQMLTSALINILYKAKEDQCQTLNLFGAFKYYYDLAPATDHAQRSAVPSDQRSWYQKPKDEDIIAEAYADYIRGPFNIKIGKQIVVWGETDIKRTVDVVNPLDLRYGSPGVVSWAEMKIGMWMMRGFYQSQLPGNLLFEFIYNPGYFQGMRLPVEGTQWGPWPDTVSFNPGHGPGIYNWTVTKAWKEYQPNKWQTSNWQLGLRLRGFSYNIDWTLVYINQLSPAPVAVPGAINNYTMKYVTAGIGSLITGGDIKPENYYGPRPYTWERYQLFGGTMQTTIDALHGSVWRLEWFYEHNAAYNKTTTGTTQGTIYDIVKRDTSGFGLNYSDKFQIPYLTRYWFNNQFLQVSLTAFYEKIFNFSNDLYVDSSRDHEYGCSSSQTYSWNIMQQSNNAIWTYIFMGSWSPIGKWWMCPMVGYGPGNHWRLEGGPIIYHNNNRFNRGGYWDKSSVLIRIRYEF
ncbi:MAG: hypothetical protein NTV89_13930 [Proteobacteria bacterium]|nr:hypothetical protein [Pseudomonadota bacterium]